MYEEGQMQRIIHIGGNKTASTLFQRRLFSQYNNIFYLGEDCHGYSKISEKLNNLVHEDDFYYDKAELVKDIELLHKESKESATHFVFSNEDIMGSKSPTVCAIRLKELFPDSKVLIIVRNQLEVFPSWYINHGAYLKNVPRKFWRRHVDLNSWLEFCFDFPSTSPVEAMNYYKYYRIFSNLFGKENTIIIPYEDISTNRIEFCKRMSNLFGIEAQAVNQILEIRSERPRNSKLKFATHKVLGFSRNITDLIYSFLEGIDKTGPANVRLSAFWRDKIERYYAEGNDKLSSETGLDLRSYKYPSG